MTHLTVDSVSYSYSRTVEALRDVSFELPAGAVLGVFGPNGAGKSTLLQCVAGLRTPRRGTVSIGGVSSANRALIERGTVTIVSESVRLPRDMTLQALLRWIAPLHARWSPALAQSLAERFQLDVARRIDALSRGEYLKAALVCALAANPAVLILDEPFAGIEVATRDTIVRGLVTAASETGMTVMLASHDVDEVATLLTHAAVLVSGALQVFGSTESIGERFSRITMVGSDLQLRTLSSEQPWNSVERSGRLVRVVADAIHTPVDRSMLERRYADATSVEVEPISLREVVALCTRDAAGVRSVPVSA
ncbi:ATP-binding cassette domain-containing protein [Gemmatimonas sp.]|jgi:ABC-2 type transport system ATP-binding protein|uniref:ATP-binding cassette domain-containing protein n=1 Tax=Gemmatimonas sp. TaxID=1962908 RepID=UPI0037BE29A7